MEKVVRFKRQEKGDFTNVLNNRVNQYFKSTNKSKHSDWRMWLKTLIMFSIYFVPYALMLALPVTGWQVMALYAVMGVGVAGIGTGVMHDAVHGSYFKSYSLNKILGLSMNMIGGSSINWRIQHNVLHHTYTNIEDMDDDITPKFILRFSPHSELKSYHKYQHIYAWFLYGLTTLSWVISKDIIQLKEYNKRNLLKKQGISFSKALLFLVISKLVYISYTLVIPLLFAGVAAGFVVGGFFVMHLVGGIILGLIFQPAHLAEELDFPLPNDNNEIEKNWGEHQLYTTANFANNNKLVTWFAGGLNYQIEHHLFPNVCHVHYKDISKIVKETAKDFKLPYVNNDTFMDALRSHQRTLQYLGTTAPVPAS